jgi:hypothetical protein
MPKRQGWPQKESGSAPAPVQDNTAAAQSAESGTEKEDY